MSCMENTGYPVRLRVGSRGSRLARWQTERFIEVLTAAHPAVCCELVVINTQGDRDKQTPLSIIGGQSVFVKEIETALVDGEIDCAVHSAKDLNTTLSPGLTLPAILDRADPRDVLLSRHTGGLASLPQGARVGTSSRRRMAQLWAARPDLVTIELRGNIDTRLSKVLDDPDGPYDGAIVAAAGVLRMGWEERIAEYLDVANFTPAPGQGALGVECRADDAAICELLQSITDPMAEYEVNAERAFLRAIGGGCRSPLAAHAQVEGDRLRMWTMYADEELHQIAMSRRRGRCRRRGGIGRTTGAHAC